MREAFKHAELVVWLCSLSCILKGDICWYRVQGLNEIWTNHSIGNTSTVFHWIAHSYRVSNWSMELQQISNSFKSHARAVGTSNSSECRVGTTFEYNLASIKCEYSL